MPRLNENSALLLKTAIDSGITNPAELANIMGNAAVETGNFSRMYEDHRYSSAARLISQVRSAPRRFSMEEIESAVSSRDPVRIFTVMYENRRDPGNTEPGDGFKYRGRGFFQYTGRSNYTEFGEKFGVDLAGNPDLAADPEMAASLAIAYWRDRVPEQYRLDPRLSGEAINGASNGAPDRVARSRDWAITITPELVEQVRSGAINLEELATVSRPARGDPTVTALQRNINALGITDAHGQRLAVDGDLGGPNSRTNQAIAAFQRQFGLEGQMSNAELLSATQAALNARRQVSLDATLPGLPPEMRLQQSPPASHPSRTYTSSPAAHASLPPLPVSQTLEPGDRGAAVLALQAHLRLVGATDRNGNAIEADRAYGPRTREAVEQFQLWTGRPTTGIADPDTLGALQEHARFAARQQAQGIAPGTHLADNLKPAAPDLADAAEVRTPQSRTASQDPAALEQGRTIQQQAIQTRPQEQERPRTGPTRTPADPGHPDHALLEKVRGLVRGLDQQAGKGWDERSERMSASALVMARQMGFTEKDELHLLFNRPSENHAAGEVLHLARTGPTASVDPGANRSYMPTEEALSKPAEERYQQVQDIAQQQELERQQALARGPDEPSRGGPVR